MKPKLNPMPESDVARRLLDAASEVIESSGEASLRVQEIVETAGVQAPVLYRYFGNREGLVQSVHLARFLRELTDEAEVFAILARAAGSKEEFRSHFDGLVRAAADPARRDRRRTRLEVLGSAMSRPELSELIGKVQSSTYGQVVDALIEAQKHGWIRAEVEPVSFVAWASSTMLGLAAVEHYGASADPAEWWTRYQVEACRAILFGDD
jgi:AcrR family transcriptional regulator